MTEITDEKNGNIPKEEFNIGIDGNPPKVMIITIPVAKYAEQGQDGMDLFYGRMKRVTVVGINMIKNLYAKKQSRIIRPGQGSNGLEIH